MMLETLYFMTIICGATVAGIYLMLTKWRIVMKLQAVDRFGINKVASCLFCLCFWIGMIINLVLVLTGAPWEIMLVSLPAAALARFIIN